MSNLSPSFRIARQSDMDAIRRLYLEVFSSPAQAQFVDQIAESSEESLSLLVEVDHRVSAHLLTTPVQLEGVCKLPLMVLEPMAVAPYCQHQGIGQTMLKVALEQLSLRSYQAVVVIGLAAYYQRFGFRPLTELGWNTSFHVEPSQILYLPLNDSELPVTQAPLLFSEPFEKLYRSLGR